MHIEKDIPFALHLQKWLMTGWLTFSRELGGAVMLDFRAAVIDHELLIGKAKSYGFTSTAIALVEDYLTGWKQKFFFNGSFSDSKIIHCSVPQGSCLGLLLFSIFTNDLPLYIQIMSILQCMLMTPLITVLIFCVMSLQLT